MSWGFFLDLDVTLPTADWERLEGLTAKTHPVPPGWWGFEEQGLDAMFSSSEGDDVVVGEMIATYADSAEAVGRITTEGTPRRSASSPTSTGAATRAWPRRSRPSSTPRRRMPRDGSAS